MGKRKLYLIDATAFCYRAFYALHGLSTSFGQPTNAIYGFINMLNKILKGEKPEYLAVCFDVSRDTFRQKKFSEYKIQRPPMPDNLSCQIPLIKEIISAYGITIYEKDGFEADDLIATLVRKAREKNFFITIISSDKDILQLVDDRTVVFSPYRDEGPLYDHKRIFERYGVIPKRIADIIALMGDKVDNIPGASGIGEKTAVELIKDFGSLDNLLGNVEKIKKERLKKIIKENLKTIKLSKELVTLNENVEIVFDLENLKIGKPDFKELFRIFKHLEFKSLLKDLPVENNELPDTKLTVLKDRQFKALVDEIDEVILYGQDLKNLVFYAQNKFFQVESSQNLKILLSCPKIKKISHDLKKIKVSLAKEGLILEGLYFDTMIAAYLVNPTSVAEYNLTDIAWDYLDKRIPLSLDGQKMLGLILELKTKLESELHAQGLFNLFTEVEMPLVEVLAQMELNGIKLDRQILELLSQDIKKRLLKLTEEIYKLSGGQFNLNSPQQLRQILFEKLKLPVVKKTKTGPSTNEEVLNKLASLHSLPALLLEYRQLAKLKNTYIDTLPDLINPRTGRVHTSFNQTATSTGRLSSSKPNLQNIPLKSEIGRIIRKAVVASHPENYLLSADYSQIELRILAHLSKDENLISAFKQNRDIHKITASFIYGQDPDQINEAMREVAKRVNFGIIYGLSAYGLSRDLGIRLEEAEGFINAYFLRYPGVKEYIQNQIKKAKALGFVTTLLGRRRYLPEINHKNQGIRQLAERQAVNMPIQGSASDLIKLAMVMIHRQIKEKRLEVRLILQIHDELVFDVPEQEINTLIGLVRDKMENAIKLDVPLRVDIKKGRNWLEMEPVLVVGQGG